MPCAKCGRMKYKRKMIDHTVTILQKDGMFASYAVDKGETSSAYLERYDARCNPRVLHQSADSLEQVEKLLNANLDICISRGWRICYEGVRNYG